VLAIWRREAAEVNPEKGDVLLYLGTRKGETAHAFNRLARGLTALVYNRGGVPFAGFAVMRRAFASGHTYRGSRVCAVFG
jgi:hypothetical protein